MRTSVRVLHACCVGRRTLGTLSGRKPEERRRGLSTPGAGGRRVGRTLLRPVPSLLADRKGVEAQGYVEPIVDNVRFDHPAPEVPGHQETAPVAAGSAGA